MSMAAAPSSGCRRRRTLALVSLGTPVGVGFVTSAVYFGRQRPRIVRASDDGSRAAPGASAGPARTRSRVG